MRRSVMCIRYVWPGVAIAALLGAGCEGRGPREARNARNAAADTGQAPPLVGGECVYDHIAFRATVDSVLPDGVLLVLPDTTLTTMRRCDRVEEVREGRWRVPGPARGPAPSPGDSVEVAAEGR